MFPNLCYCMNEIKGTELILDIKDVADEQKMYLLIFPPPMGSPHTLRWNTANEKLVSSMHMLKQDSQT